MTQNRFRGTDFKSPTNTNKPIYKSSYVILSPKFGQCLIYNL